ncbi:MAG: nucleotide exchange factor GrpE [Parachlamydiales bacterium]|jgi:molecular chaperone GrpE
MDEEISMPEDQLPDEFLEEVEAIVEPVAQPKATSVDEIERLRNEARENKEKYLHALAEGENSRKRLQKERQEMLQHAIQNVIVEFINPIDQLENALKFAEQASPEVKNWVIGFNMILEQFKDVLTHHGVSTFASEGHPFDPHFHEAIEVVVSEDHPPGTVVKEHLRGYKSSSGKVIRPARVHVSKAQEEKEISE